MPDKRRKQKRGKSVRKVFLKFRIRPLVRMPRSVMFAKLEKATHTGIVPDDIEIATMDWEKKIGRKYAGGSHLTPPEMDDLKAAYLVLVSADAIRFEYPRKKV